MSSRSILSSMRACRRSESGNHESNSELEEADKADYAECRQYPEISLGQINHLISECARARASTFVSTRRTFKKQLSRRALVHQAVACAVPRSRANAHVLTHSRTHARIYPAPPPHLARARASALSAPARPCRRPSRHSSGAAARAAAATPSCRPLRRIGRRCASASSSVARAPPRRVGPAPAAAPPASASARAASPRRRPKRASPSAASALLAADAPRPSSSRPR
eukprot:2893899-Pleurochrysis_carterae.AAC.2